MMRILSALLLVLCLRIVRCQNAVCSIEQYYNVTNPYIYSSFQHAALPLARCWSYFQENRAEECFFLDGPQLRTAMADTRDNNKYISNLLRMTGCKIIDSTSSEIYTPKRVRGDVIQWFSKSEHAVALRDRIIGKVLSDRTETESNGFLKVGLIQRQKYRVITNIKTLAEAIKKEYPGADVDCCFDPESSDLVEQAEWFASKDLIVGAHGGAMTNTMFIQKNTVVLQLYPPHYYPNDFYEPLIEKCEGIAVDLHSEVTDLSTYEKRVAYRAANIDADVPIVMEVIRHARERNHPLNNVNTTEYVRNKEYYSIATSSSTTGSTGSVGGVGPNSADVKLDLDASMECAVTHSHSQHFADIALLPYLLNAAKETFGGKGVFVEIGALDGVRFSNTLMLERCFNWTGVLIEGSKENYAQLLKNTVRAGPKVYSAVCSPEGTVRMAGSGEQAGQSREGEENGVVTPCAPLGTIMQRAGFDRATFLSLDVEGAEWMVINTVDPMLFDIIFVEADGNDKDKDLKVKRYILEAGLVWARYFSLGKNGIYVKPYLAKAQCGENCWRTHQQLLSTGYVW